MDKIAELEMRIFKIRDLYLFGIISFKAFNQMRQNYRTEIKYLLQEYVNDNRN